MIIRSHADNVLQEALQVRDELQKTLEAQKDAESAIAKSREDIDAADIDLKQVCIYRRVLSGCVTNNLRRFLTDQ
jgi:hypothetical protein